MSIKKILAPVVGSSRDANVLGSAFAIAKPLEAHVSALFVKPDPARALLYFDPPAPADVLEQTITTTIETAKKASDAAQAEFEKSAKKSEAPIIPHPKKDSGFSCSFAETTGLFQERIASLATFSDLVVFGAITENDSFELGEAFLDTLNKSGQPVLLSPKTIETIPAKIAVGWDGSGAAMRAVRASIPFLKNAGAAEIIMIRRPGAHTPLLQSMRDYLLLHGIVCHEHVVDPGTEPIGDVLVRSAVEIESDLLVLGGYGQHSYWREALFGGVTSHVRWHASLPVLMVH